MGRAATGLSFDISMLYAKDMALQDVGAKDRYDVLTQSMTFGLHLRANNHRNELVLHI